MTVRPFRPEDEPAWAAMRQALWPDCADEIDAYERAAALRRPDYQVFLALDCGRYLGFAEVSVRSRVEGSTAEHVGYLEGWYVEEAARGRGVGRALVAAAEAWAADRGLTEFASDAEITNEGSIRAHRALGFRETFRIVQFLKPIGSPQPRVGGSA